MLLRFGWRRQLRLTESVNRTPHVFRVALLTQLVRLGLNRIEIVGAPDRLLGALRKLLPVCGELALKFVVLSLQIGDLVIESVTRRMPLLLLRNVRGRRGLHLKFQLLLEQRDHFVKFVVQFAVSPLHIGAEGRGAQAAVRPV